MTHDKYMIAVWGAPGAGKTTLAVNMATVLADSGYMTCLVSGTDHGELQAFFGTSIPKGKGLYAAISNGRNVRESLTQARPNLCILELDTGGDSFDIVSITPDQVQHMLSDLRDQFSYVVVDCTSHKESTFTGVGLAESDKVIVAIPHRVSAATWHIANTQMLEAVAGKTIYVDVNTREGGCDMDQLLSSMGLPDCDFKLNCVDAAYLCENTGRPIVTNSGRAEKIMDVTTPTPTLRKLKELFTLRNTSNRLLRTVKISIISTRLSPLHRTPMKDSCGVRKTFLTISIPEILP